MAACEPPSSCVPGFLRDSDESPFYCKSPQLLLQMICNKNSTSLPSFLSRKIVCSFHQLDPPPDPRIVKPFLSCCLHLLFDSRCTLDEVRVWRVACGAGVEADAVRVAGVRFPGQQAVHLGLARSTRREAAWPSGRGRTYLRRCAGIDCHPPPPETAWRPRSRRRFRPAI